MHDDLLAERDVDDGRKGASFDGASATVEEGRDRHHDTLDLYSLMPGKIGSERHSRARAR